MSASPSDSQVDEDSRTIAIRTGPLVPEGGSGARFWISICSLAFEERTAFFAPPFVWKSVGARRAQGLQVRQA